MRQIKVVVLLVRQLQHGFTKNAKVAPKLTVAHLSPDAKWRIFIASFKPGSRDFRYGVSCLAISGLNLSRSSSNMSGGTRRKLK